MSPMIARTVYRDLAAVDGWFTREAAFLFALLDEAQKSQNVQGDLFEIGVHHGRSTILLAACLDRGRERLGVCDLFDQQNGNASHSGRGNYEIFTQNMQRVFGVVDFLDVFSRSSSRLSRELIGVRNRMIHIDGGHLRSECLHDLELAATALVDDGIILIDDAFRIDWPGVTEATIEFLKSDRGFVPLVGGFNKLVIASRFGADRYREFIRSHWSMFITEGRWRMKTDSLCDGDYDVFFEPPVGRVGRLVTACWNVLHKN